MMSKFDYFHLYLCERCRAEVFKLILEDNFQNFAGSSEPHAATLFAVFPKKCEYQI
jgi:hypothetical protein